MAITNPYDTGSSYGILSALGAQQGLSGQDMLTNMLNPTGVSNLGLGAQSTAANKYDPNGYAQLYQNWVNQQLAPLMQKYGQQQPAAASPTQTSLQQLQAQIADMRQRLAPFYTSGSGGN